MSPPSGGPLAAPMASGKAAEAGKSNVQIGWIVRPTCWCTSASLTKTATAEWIKESWDDSGLSPSGQRGVAKIQASQHVLSLRYQNYLLSENPEQERLCLFILVLSRGSHPSPPKKIKSYRPAGKKTSDTHTHTCPYMNQQWAISHLGMGGS